MKGKLDTHFLLFSLQAPPSAHWSLLCSKPTPGSVFRNHLFLGVLRKPCGTGSLTWAPASTPTHGTLLVYVLLQSLFTFGSPNFLYILKPKLFGVIFGIAMTYRYTLEILHFDSRPSQQNNYLNKVSHIYFWCHNVYESYIFNMLYCY